MWDHEILRSVAVETTVATLVVAGSAEVHKRRDTALTSLLSRSRDTRSPSDEFADPGEDLGEFFEEGRPSAAQAGDTAVFEEGAVEHVGDP